MFESVAEALLRKLAKPRSGVVLAGIAFPVIVMAMRWTELSAPWRWAMVSAFLVSVAGVGIYIYRLSRSLVSD